MVMLETDTYEVKEQKYIDPEKLLHQGTSNVRNQYYHNHLMRWPSNRSLPKPV